MGLMANVKSKRLAIISALVAGLLWGSWAFYVNASASNVWVSAFVQFISSMLMTGVMSWLVVKTQSIFSGRLLRVVLPAVIASSAAVVILLILHTIASTENILPTILSPALVGFLYCLFFSSRTSSSAVL